MKAPRLVTFVATLALVAPAAAIEKTPVAPEQPVSWAGERGAGEKKALDARWEEPAPARWQNGRGLVPDLRDIGALVIPGKAVWFGPAFGHYFYDGETVLGCQLQFGGISLGTRTAGALDGDALTLRRSREREEFVKNMRPPAEGSGLSTDNSPWHWRFGLSRVWGISPFRDFDPDYLETLPEPYRGEKEVRVYKREGGGWEIEIIGENGAVGRLLFDEDLRKIERAYLQGELVFEWDKHKDRVRHPIVVVDGEVVPQPPKTPYVEPPVPLERQVREAIAAGDFAAVKKKLDAAEWGLDDPVNERGATLLMFAVGEDKTELVKAFLETGARADLRGGGGWTALMIAAKEGYLECARLLLDAGADPSLQSARGETPLIMAAKDGGHILSGNAASEEAREIASLLIARGAKLDSRDDKGYNALMHAASRGDREMFDLLKGKGAADTAKFDDGHNAEEYLKRMELLKRNTDAWERRQGQEEAARKVGGS